MGRFIRSVFAIAVGVILCSQPTFAADAPDLPKLVAKVKPSVVTVLVYEDEDDKPDRQGSGWFYDDGKVVTNFHVVKNGKRAEIKLSDNRVFKVAGTVADSAEQDLVLLAIERLKDAPPPLKISEANIAEGQKVFVVGSPLGLEHSVSDGIISSVRELSPYGAIVQTTASISHGSSGSPILDLDGNVVAVATFTFNEGQALNFGVSADALEQLKPALVSPIDRLATREVDAMSTPDVLAAFALQNKDPAGAIIHIDAAIKANPRNWLAWGIKGDCLEATGHHEQSIECYKQVIRLNPDNALVHYNLGVNYGKLDHTQEEIACYKEAIRIQPDYADAHYNLGVTYFELRLRQEAIECFKQAIRSKPGLAAAHFNLGISYLIIGDPAKALEEYKVLKTIDAQKAEELFKAIYP